MSYKDDNKNLHKVRYNSSDLLYICGRCGRDKNISSYGPPVYNAQNCSCADLASFAEGYEQSTSPTHIPLPRAPLPYTYTSHAPVTYQESSTTDRSAEGPEGVETHVPNLEIATGYLPVNAGPNMTEAARHNSSSLPWSMQRFLDQTPTSPHLTYQDTELPSSKTSKFLKLSSQIGAPTTLRKSSSKRKSSAQTSAGNFEEEGSEQWRWEVDPLTGAGGWVDAEGNWFEVIEGRYPYAPAIQGCFRAGCQG